ncbi:MAG: hypothetical protein JJT78_15535 [Leptospira sp.]|nr:hypothetical protein [Leptospira sp.]
MKPVKFQIKDILFTQVFDHKGNIDWNQSQDDPIVDTLTKGNLYFYSIVLCAIQTIPITIIASALWNIGVEAITIIYAGLGVFSFLSLVSYKLIFMIFSHYHKMKTIHIKGIYATGEILYCLKATWKPKIRPPKLHGNLIHLLCYTYHLRSGESVRLWSACSLEEYKKILPGQKFEIQYDPESPLFHLRSFG